MIYILLLYLLLFFVQAEIYMKVPVMCPHNPSQDNCKPCHCPSDDLCIKYFGVVGNEIKATDFNRGGQARPSVAYCEKDQTAVNISCVTNIPGVTLKKSRLTRTSGSCDFSYCKTKSKDDCSESSFLYRKDRKQIAYAEITCTRLGSCNSRNDYIPNRHDDDDENEDNLKKKEEQYNSWWKSFF